MKRTKVKKTDKPFPESLGISRGLATKKKGETYLEKYEEQEMTTMNLVAFAAIEAGIDTNVDTDSIEEWEDTLWAKLAVKGITQEKGAQSWCEVFPDWFMTIQGLWLNVGSYGPDATPEMIASTRALCEGILEDHSRDDYKKLKNLERIITHYTPIPSVLKMED